MLYRVDNDVATTAREGLAVLSKVKWHVLCSAGRPTHNYSYASRRDKARLTGLRKHILYCAEYIGPPLKPSYPGPLIPIARVYQLSTSDFRGICCHQLKILNTAIVFF